MAKNTPAVQEPWVQAWVRYTLEKGVAARTSILTGRVQWAEELGRPLSHGATESDTTGGPAHRRCSEPA